MTNQHPLTDDIIEEIARFDPDKDDMRAAADWQLELVFNWLIEYVFDNSLFVVEDMPEKLYQAMRPTQESN